MTKKILVALALFPLAAQANVTTGTFELSGDSNVSFESGSRKVDNGTFSTTTDTTDYGLGVAGLYYVNPNLGIGATLQYAKSKEEAGGVESSLSTFLIGPAVALDFPVAPQLSVFGRGFIGYASSTVTETGSPDVTPTGFGFGLQGGVKYFVVKSVSFDAGLGYTWLRLKESPVEVTTSGLGLDVGLSVYFGGASH